MKIEVYIRDNNQTFNNLMFFYIFVFDKTSQRHLKRTYVGSIESGRDSPIQVGGCFVDEDMCFYKEALKQYRLIHEENVGNFRESNISNLFAELMSERFI